jgi:hypothetical protein
MIAADSAADLRAAAEASSAKPRQRDARESDTDSDDSEASIYHESALLHRNRCNPGGLRLLVVALFRRAPTRLASAGGVPACQPVAV